MNKQRRFYQYLGAFSLITIVCVLTKQVSLLLGLLTLLWGPYLITAVLLECRRQLIKNQQSWEAQRTWPLQYVLDPNRPPNDLLMLGANYPEVLENIAIPLLQLEEPRFYQELTRRVEAGNARRAQLNAKAKKRFIYLALSGLAFSSITGLLLLLITKR